MENEGPQMSDKNMPAYRKNAMNMTLFMIVVSATAITASTPIHAGAAGWFIGGVAASRIGHNMRERTQAEQQQANYSQQSAVYQASTSQTSASQNLSPEARIQQLDKLAAGGYITPEEYKTKKEAILNSL
jgi:hypothetical protein